jgi:predicted transcriptional regulator
MMYTAFQLMYTVTMRRLQIYIDDDMDESLAIRARREGTSKAALIRNAVREQYGEYATDDPLDEWVGLVDAESGDIDDVVYGE